MPIEKKIINLDISTLDKFEEKKIVDYSWKTISEKVSEMANDILSEENYFINEFKGEYIENIIIEINKWISIEVISNIENIIEIFLNKYFNINNFHFWKNHFMELKEKNKEIFLDFFEETFLKEFYTFLLNINYFNIPTIYPDAKEWWIFNWTLFWYLDNWKVNFKFEYETSKEIHKKSFNESKIVWCIEDKEDDIKKNKIKENQKKYKNEIIKLENYWNAIDRLFSKLIDNKNAVFKKYIQWNIYNDLEQIIIFLSKNNDDIYDKFNNSLYVEYFINLIEFITTGNNFVTFTDFNVWFERNTELSTLDKNLYSKIWNNYEFYTQVMQEFDHIIKDMIDEKVWWNLGDNWFILRWEIMENESDSKVLLLENKIDNYIWIFNVIINELNSSKEEKIVNIFIDKNLFERQESLLDFIEENREELLKLPEWKIIYDFVWWISEVLLKKSFSDYINDFNISESELRKMPDTFLNIIRKLYI